MNKPNKTILASVIACVLSNGMLVSASFANGANDDAQQAQTSQVSTTGADASQAVQLQEVKVTSRRVEELAQDVPLPITVVSAATIENKGFENVQDISLFTPGFTFHEGFGRLMDRPVIRGQVNVLGEPNASFFIDGVFVQGDISGYDLSDIERVEVIRGPQSALFGRRTFSGAVNFVTKLPTATPSGGATLQFGNKGQKQARLNYSGPISDTLSFRVNAYHDQTDGLFRNSVSGKDDLGGRKTTSLGGSLYWHPNTSFSATLRANYQRDEDQSPAFYRYGLEAANCGGTPTGQLYAFFAPIYTAAPNICGKVKVPDQFAVNTPSFDLSGYDAGIRRHSLRTSLSLEYYFENNWQLTSTSAYNTSDDYLGLDQDYSGTRGFAGAMETFNKRPTHDFSQEFRLASDQSQPLHGLIGVYYYKQGNGYGYKGDLTGFNLMPGQPGNNLSPVATSALTPDATVENRAIFGLLEYRFNDQWKASVELRRGQDKIGSSGVDNQMLVIGGVNTPVSRTYNNTSTFNSTVPRFTVDYSPAPGLHFYGLLAKGNKPGGFNESVEDARLTDASRQQMIDQGFDKFKEENAWTTEVGIKSMWLQNRLRVNADVFNIDWKDQQLTSSATNQWINGQSGSMSYIDNIGKSRIRGLEIEGEFLISREWLVNFAYTHLDTRIVDQENPSFIYYTGRTNASGNNLPQVPENSGTLGVTYKSQLANGWGVFGNVDANFEGSRYGDVNNLVWTGSSTTFNASLGIEPVKNLRISAYVRNAFNDKTTEDILMYISPERLIAYPNLVTGTGYQVGYGRGVVVTGRMPRLFGLRMDYKF